MFYVGVKVKVIYRISEYESQCHIISIYSKIKENYFCILEIEKKGWIIHTIWLLNDYCVNSCLGARLKHHP